VNATFVCLLAYFFYFVCLSGRLFVCFVLFVSLFVRLPVATRLLNRPIVQPIRSRGKATLLTRVSVKLMLDSLLLEFICIIFCLSMLLVKAFNTLDLNDMFSEFVL
jgi:hypothetical protein